MRIAVIALTLTASAFAQRPFSSMHCSKPDDWTTVCEFSDGTVHVTSSFSDGQYFANWFTAAEWKRYSAMRWPPPIPSNVKSEAEAHSWHTPDGCEGDGFTWHDGACHAHATIPVSAVQTQASVPADAQGRCAIGTRYDTKGNCIVHPTADERSSFGFIKDKQRQAFWAKEELRRREGEATSKVIEEELKKPH